MGVVAARRATAASCQRLRRSWPPWGSPGAERRDDGPAGLSRTATGLGRLGRAHGAARGGGGQATGAGGCAAGGDRGRGALRAPPLGAAAQGGGGRGCRGRIGAARLGRRGAKTRCWLQQGRPRTWTGVGVQTGRAAGSGLGGWSWLSMQGFAAGGRGPGGLEPWESRAAGPGVGAPQPEGGLQRATGRDCGCVHGRWRADGVQGGGVGWWSWLGVQGVAGLLRADGGPPCRGRDVGWRRCQRLRLLLRSTTSVVGRAGQGREAAGSWGKQSSSGHNAAPKSSAGPAPPQLHRPRAMRGPWGCA